MKIKINHSKKIETAKDEFNNFFPFLKIEFFNTPHAPGEPSSRNDMINDNRMFGEINGFIKDGIIILAPDDKVSTIEQSFHQQFGLTVQVFRKQKEVWIETTKTVHLTLAEQNEKGRSFSAAEIYKEPGDRYLEDGQY